MTQQTETTPEQREQSARYEAFLRNLQYAETKAGPLLFSAVEAAAGSACYPHDGIHKPLNPDDPADMWKLMDLAEWSVMRAFRGAGWIAGDHDPWGGDVDVLGDGDTPLEAARAAWLEAARRYCDDASV